MYLHSDQTGTLRSTQLPSQPPPPKSPSPQEQQLQLQLQSPKPSDLETIPENRTLQLSTAVREVSAESNPSPIPASLPHCLPDGHPIAKDVCCPITCVRSSSIESFSAVGV